LKHASAAVLVLAALATVSAAAARYADRSVFCCFTLTDQPSAMTVAVSAAMTMTTMIVMTLTSVSAVVLALSVAAIASAALARYVSLAFSDCSMKHWLIQLVCIV
jgi:hypothetical protein